MKGLIWFRQDVRLTDNEAVIHAWENSTELHAVAVVTPRQWQQHRWSDAKLNLYQRLLNELGNGLANIGVQLHVLTCVTYEQIPARLLELCEHLGTEKLWFNREYPLDEVRRDRAVCGWLEKHNIETQYLDSNLLVAPERVKTGQGDFYKKFTPFYRQWKKVLSGQGIGSPTKLNSRGNRVKYHPSSFAPECDAANHWADSEQVIADQLQAFISESVVNYNKDRDFPSRPGTSRFSPYFELGILSPITVARQLQKLSPEFPHGLPEGAETWLSELAWREFYQHLMFHVPSLSKGKPFLTETDQYPWRHDMKDFERWCNGCTGVPIVDAGMRQLRSEKWMHNRVRMIVASYLTKDLHIDWRLGEQYFMEQLIDGSFPANNGGWQWSASTGTDAVPYFRVFNPYRQSERFDPQGEYIRTWVEELADVPDKNIHEPQQWLKENDPDNDYPQPMVDHSEQRTRFIERFKRIKGK